jgi:hypothetical protein
MNTSPWSYLNDSQTPTTRHLPSMWSAAPVLQHHVIRSFEQATDVDRGRKERLNIARRCLPAGLQEVPHKVPHDLLFILSYSSSKQDYRSTVSPSSNELQPWCRSASRLSCRQVLVVTPRPPFCDWRPRLKEAYRFHPFKLELPNPQEMIEIRSQYTLWWNKIWVICFWINTHK